MRVDEGRSRWNIPAIKMKPRTVVRRGEKSLLSDPSGSELRVGRENDEGKVRR